MAERQDAQITDVNSYTEAPQRGQRGTPLGVPPAGVVMNASATEAERHAARRARIRAEVATWPPLTEEQLGELAVLLRPAALELRRREREATVSVMVSPPPLEPAGRRLRGPGAR